MSSFLKKIQSKYQVQALLSSDAKDILGADASHVEADLRRLQNEIAAQLVKIESKIQEQLKNSQQEAKIKLLRKQIRTSLAKWVYLSSFKGK